MTDEESLIGLLLDSDSTLEFHLHEGQLFGRYTVGKRTLHTHNISLGKLLQEFQEWRDEL